MDEYYNIRPCILSRYLVEGTIIAWADDGLFGALSVQKGPADHSEHDEKEPHQDNPVPHIIGMSLVLGFIFMLFVDQVIIIKYGPMYSNVPISAVVSNVTSHLPSFSDPHFDRFGSGYSTSLLSQWRCGSTKDLNRFPINEDALVPLLLRNRINF
jgi:hypothetical protein